MTRQPGSVSRSAPRDTSRLAVAADEALIPELTKATGAIVTVKAAGGGS